MFLSEGGIKMAITIKNDFIDALIKFSNGRVTREQAIIIANQNLRETDFNEGSPLTHKGPRWLAKRILRSKNIID